MCLGLVALVALLYVPTARYDFVFDDIAIVVENPHVTAGLTREGVGWAFTDTDVNWHPLTWISHMLDTTLFGPGPGGRHLTNVAFHAVNSALLLRVLHAMTGAFWPAAVVAALFAVHPLRVESVAWISERKDVLAVFFWLLTMLAYVAYARRPVVGRYLVVVALFALGLMAKATLVTLPVALLLLDVWPLGRWSDRRSARRLLAEKVPLLFLSAAVSAATVLAQHQGGAAQSVAMLPLVPRVENALVAYVTYLGMAIWPTRLACFYPHPAIGAVAASSALPGAAIGAALALIGISMCVFGVARRRPYVAVGWLWYLITLLPNIGLVQVGQQAMADRFTHIPLLGIFVLVVWAVRDLVAERPGARRAVAVGTAVVLCGYAAVTWFQVRTWRDSETLYRHALRVTVDNHLAHQNLGNAFLRKGKVAEAKLHLEAAVRIQPTIANAQNNLGAALLQEGDYRAATAHFAAALRIDPSLAGAHNNLGIALFDQGQFRAAADHFARAIEVQPDYAEAHNGLGNALLRQGRRREAAAAYAEALRLRPRYADPYSGLGVMFFEEGDLPQAAAHFERALEVDPSHKGARSGLDRVRSLLGDR